MQDDISVMQAMMDDAFQTILTEDPVLQQLEKQKNNPTDEYFELMMILSKIFKICGTPVTCITPAKWAFLYAIKNEYTKQGGKPKEIDTDLFLYILANDMQKIDENFINNAAGFCLKHNIDYMQARLDIENLIYLSFRPLEMLSMVGHTTGEEIRYNADWITQIVSIVCPLTNKTQQQVIYETSLTQCYYYYIQTLRKNDIKNQIKRRNSDQINQAIFKRTMELGQKYYAENYCNEVK